MITVSGYAQCITSTMSVPFPTPVYAAYSGNPHSDWAGKDRVTGPLPTHPPLTDMASSMGHTGFDAGTFAGTPTVSVAVKAVIGAGGGAQTESATDALNGPSIFGSGKNSLQLFSD